MRDETKPTLDEKIESLMQENKDLSSQVNQLDKEKAELSNQVNKLTQEKEELDKDNTELTKQSQVLCKQLDEAFHAAGLGNHECMEKASVEYDASHISMA